MMSIVSGTKFYLSPCTVIYPSTGAIKTAYRALFHIMYSNNMRFDHV